MRRKSPIGVNFRKHPCKLSKGLVLLSKTIRVNFQKGYTFSGSTIVPVEERSLWGCVPIIVPSIEAHQSVQRTEGVKQEVARSTQKYVT